MRTKNVGIFVLGLILLSGALLSGMSVALAQDSATPQLQDTAARPSKAAVAEPLAAPSRLMIPAGTKVPLVLKAGVSTKNARPGDSVYAQTSFPIAVNNRILIPAGTYVQGVISNVQRAGRIKGKAEVLFHFTTLVFPSGYTVVLPASVENVPGADKTHMKGDEGAIQADGSKGKALETVASTTVTGAAIGAIAGGGKGAGIGSGIGGAAGLLITLLSRGNEVRLAPGDSVEMVIQRDVELDAARVHAPPPPPQ